MRSTAATALSLALVLVAVVPFGGHAQDLPPELTGDFSDTPPARPAPPPRPTPAPPPAPARPAPAPSPSRQAPPPSAPELDAPPPEFDPELGDVGPLPPELMEEAPDESSAEATPGVDDLEAPPTEDDTSDESAPSPTRFFVGVGIGVGTLSFSRPAEGGDLTLPTSPFAASDVDVRVQLWPSEGLSFELLAAYQTSLGWVVEMDPLFALPEKVRVRAQRMELSVAPVLRWTESISLALPIGLGMQLFTPKAHQYNLDPYAIGSALVRAEAIVKLTDTLSVRGGPELHWLGFFNNALESEGACCSGGALGVQATVQANLTNTFHLALAFRELRSLIPVAARFRSTERIATARIVGEL